MFSVFYVLEQYVFTRTGMVVAAVLAALVWLANNAPFGQSGNSESDVVVMSWLAIWIVSCGVSAAVGAVIDGRRGALWGFFLGPLGWIIASIRRLEARRSPLRGPKDATAVEINEGRTETQAHLTYDAKKWAVLKYVDDDIKAASERVAAIDPTLEAVLAEKYLRLSQKEYLQPLVDKLLADATAQPRL